MRLFRRVTETRTRVRGPEIDSPAPRNPRHQGRPENAAAANTGPRNAITAAVAVQHRTADPYDLWIADNASRLPRIGSTTPMTCTAAAHDAEAALSRARLLHPTPAELVAAHAECDTLCPTCIYPAPCPTRRALDGQE
jgi:hypothetical protein